MIDTRIYCCTVRRQISIGQRHIIKRNELGQPISIGAKCVHHIMTGNMKPAAAVLRCQAVIEAGCHTQPSDLCAIVYGILYREYRLRSVVKAIEEVLCKVGL